jgi:hypothetical protein
VHVAGEEDDLAHAAAADGLEELAALLGKPAHLSGISDRSSGNIGTEETTNLGASAGDSTSHCTSALIWTVLMIRGSAPARFT